MLYLHFCIILKTKLVEGLKSSFNDSIISVYIILKWCILPHGTHICIHSVQTVRGTGEKLWHTVYFFLGVPQKVNLALVECTTGNQHYTNE